MVKLNVVKLWSEKKVYTHTKQLLQKCITRHQRPDTGYCMLVIEELINSLFEIGIFVIIITIYMSIDHFPKGGGAFSEL